MFLVRFVRKKSILNHRSNYEQDSEAKLGDEVDALMSSDILSTHFSTKNITFTRVQTGWLLRQDRTEKVHRVFRFHGNI